ncbi:unnamed protein product [Pedinophyceae sp. YPF-701]|nr:unnamed protein product [Pedinophyceae sp. YPF-701]
MSSLYDSSTPGTSLEISGTPVARGQQARAPASVRGRHLASAETSLASIRASMRQSGDTGATPTPSERSAIQEERERARRGLKADDSSTSIGGASTHPDCAATPRSDGRGSSVLSGTPSPLVAPRGVRRGQSPSRPPSFSRRNCQRASSAARGPAAAPAPQGADLTVSGGSFTVHSASDLSVDDSISSSIGALRAVPAAHAGRGGAAATARPPPDLPATASAASLSDWSRDLTGIASNPPSPSPAKPQRSTRAGAGRDPALADSSVDITALSDVTPARPQRPTRSAGAPAAATRAAPSLAERMQRVRGDLDHALSASSLNQSASTAAPETPAARPTRAAVPIVNRRGPRTPLSDLTANSEGTEYPTDYSLSSGPHVSVTSTPVRAAERRAAAPHAEDDGGDGDDDDDSLSHTSGLSQSVTQAGSNPPARAHARYADEDEDPSPVRPSHARPDASSDLDRTAASAPRGSAAPPLDSSASISSSWLAGGSDDGSGAPSERSSARGGRRLPLRRSSASLASLSASSRSSSFASQRRRAPRAAAPAQSPRAAAPKREESEAFGDASLRVSSSTEATAEDPSTTGGSGPLRRRRSGAPPEAVAYGGTPGGSPADAGPGGEDDDDVGRVVSSISPKLKSAAARASAALSEAQTASLTSAEFERFTREVAASVIQHYWRRHAAAPQRAREPAAAPHGAAASGPRASEPARDARHAAVRAAVVHGSPASAWHTATDGAEASSWDSGVGAFAGIESKASRDADAASTPRTEHAEGAASAPGGDASPPEPRVAEPALTRSLAAQQAIAALQAAKQRMRVRLQSSGLSPVPSPRVTATEEDGAAGNGDQPSPVRADAPSESPARPVLTPRDVSLSEGPAASRYTDVSQTGAAGEDGGHDRASPVRQVQDSTLASVSEWCSQISSPSPPRREAPAQPAAPAPAAAPAPPSGSPPAPWRPWADAPAVDTMVDLSISSSEGGASVAMASLRASMTRALAEAARADRAPSPPAAPQNAQPDPPQPATAVHAPASATAPAAEPAPRPAQGAGAGVRDSVTAVKIRSILQYLDDVDAAMDTLPALSPRENGGSAGAAPQRPAARTATPATAPRTNGDASGTSTLDNTPLGTPEPEAAHGEGAGGARADPAVTPPSPRQDKSSQLAAAVVGGLREKLGRYERMIEEANGRCECLERANDDLRAEMRAGLEAAGRSHEAELAAQRAAHEEALQRHLQFIDRLLADKEALAGKCADLNAQIEGLRKRGDAQVLAMKGRLQDELKRHKAAWAATEQSKREAWVKHKEAEIKEMTVRAMEPEVQRLVAKHRGELRRLEEGLREEHRLLRETMEREHAGRLAAARDEAQRAREDAAAAERTGADARLAQAREAHEAACAALRTRLAAEADARVAEVEAARRKDRERLEWEAEAARKELAAARDAARERAEEDRRALEARHERALARAKEEFDVEREGWRAAVAERARREMQERESALRARVEEERVREVDEIAERLEAEWAARVEEAERRAAAAERAQGEAAEAEVARVRAMLQAATDRNGALQARCEVLEAAKADGARAAEELARREGALAAELQRAREAAAARESEAVRARAEAEGELRLQLRRAQEEGRAAQTRMVDVLRRCEDLKAKHAEEVAALEERVRRAIERKDGTIRSLRGELQLVQGQLAELQGMCG